jgi:hypothetical protein
MPYASVNSEKVVYLFRPVPIAYANAHGRFLDALLKVPARVQRNRGEKCRLPRARDRA